MIQVYWQLMVLLILLSGQLCAGTGATDSAPLPQKASTVHNHGALPSKSTHSDSVIKLTADEQAWLRAHKEIRLGIDPAWAPIEFFF